MGSDRKPNWKKWRHVPHVKIWEAVALSLGIEPKEVDIDPNGWMTGHLIFNEFEEFNDRIFVAGRQVETSSGFDVKSRVLDDPSNCTVDLGEFAAWALSIEWDIPPEFEAMSSRDEGKATRTVAASPSPTAKKKQEAGAAENSLGTRERGTLLKLVLGMALAGYAYDPRAPRSPVAKEIADDLQKHGISISDDTVRQWLNTAAAEIEWQRQAE